MTLPTFRSLAARRQTNEKEVQENGGAGPGRNPENSERTHAPGVDIKEATRTRKRWIVISSFFFFISFIFLILTIIGNINNRPVIRDTYIYSLDLTNIIPYSANDVMLVNSLARSLGLHDFYQVGLWNFCEGYNDEGITYCSNPRSLYWFNPVEILLNELLAGATIALPAEITDILSLIRTASHVMFGFYLTGICMNFLSIFLASLALKSRWWSFPLAIWTFIAALFTTAATIIATVMAVIFRDVATSQPDLNISASVGRQMLGFMWTASAFSIFGFSIHLGMSCCCASRRDVRTGRRKGRLSAYGDAAGDEKKRPLNIVQWKKIPKFMRRRTRGEAV